MQNYHARIFYRISLLMFFMSFLALLSLIIVLFILGFLDAFDCAPSSGCQLTQSYHHYYYIIGVLIGVFALCLLAAGYFQRYFLFPEEVEAKLAKPAKVKPKKIFKRKDTEVYESPVQISSVRQSRISTQAPPKVLSKHEEEPVVLPVEEPTEILDRNESIPIDAPAIEPPQGEPGFSDSKVMEAKPAELSEDVREESLPAEEVIPKPAVLRDENDSSPRVELPLIHAKRRTQSHTKEDISLIIEEQTPLNRETARKFLDTLCAVIFEELRAHRKVSIHQFGTFSTSQLKAREMNVPTRNEYMTNIPERYVVRFKQSDFLEDFINHPENYLAQDTASDNEQ